MLDNQVTVSTTNSLFAEGISIAPTVSATVHNAMLSTTALNLSGCQAFGVNSFGSVRIVNSFIQVNAPCGIDDAVTNQGNNTVYVNNSSLRAAHFALLTFGPGSPIKVGGSQLDAPTLVNNSTAATSCVNSFRGDYSAIAGPNCS